MPATIRLGTCSFADEGLLKAWYPRGVSTPKARLAYYAERFDTVEVDSPYYHLPDPAVTGNWAQRTPPEFMFHVKAHKTMTLHEAAEREAFAEFRASLEPLELSGKLRGILLQYHPRFVKSAAAMARARAGPGAPRPARAARRVPPPLVDGAGRTRGHARVPRAQRARLRLRGHADDPRLERRRPHAVATHPVAYVRFHGRNEKTWNIKAEKSSERFNWMYSAEELEEWVQKLGQLADEADEVYAMFNNNRDDFAPRSAAILRGLLDEAGVGATGGIEPPPLAPTLF